MSDDDEQQSMGPRDLIGLGGLMVGFLVLGLVVGWLVDDVLGSTPVCTLVGLACGIAGGAVITWLRIREFLHS